MAINMTKGSEPVSMTKSKMIRARVMWPPHTDYDLGAEVVYRDGHTESVAAFPAKNTPVRMQTTDGKIRHLGDVRRSGAAMAEEVIEIELTDDIAAVVPWAYRSQSDGGGSFKAAQVSMELDNGQGESVHIASVDASRNPAVYTCIPGVIENTTDGVKIHALELYSFVGSEHRPAASLRKTSGLFKSKGGLSVEVKANGGPRNAFK
jgi:tellurite resistance protein TerA